jgi:multidrug resistance efflux pump
LELNFDEGDKVVKDQILGRQDMPNLPDTSIELSLFRAPISGTVVKKQGTVGEIISAGQTVAMLIDPNKLYITANLEETKLVKIKKGKALILQLTNSAIDSFMAKLNFVGQAANSTFSLYRHLLVHFY